LVELEKQRRHILTEAYRCLHQGRYQQARLLIDSADNLRRDEETRRLRALIHFLRRDFPTTWKIYTSVSVP
jgi:hypothetical protein